MRVMLLPGAPPQLDRRVFVGDDIRAQREGRSAHRSVSFSSMRRLRLKAASVVSGSIGWNSPKPAATSRCGETPLLIRYCTTEIARAAERSQFDLKVRPAVGRMSVWPSTRITQA